MFQSIPNVTKNLLIINVLAYLATMVLDHSNIDLELLGGLHFFMSPYFHFYQFLTYQFLHGSLTHLFFNMFALWMFGCSIEQEWGGKKYLIYYLLCGVGAGLCQEVVQFFTGSYGLTIGASGAIFAILLAYGMVFPRRIIGIPLAILALVVIDLVNTSPSVQMLLSVLNQVFFIAIIIAIFNPANGFSQRIWRLLYTRPVEARWCIIGYIAIEILYIIKNVPGDSIAHMAHLGGMLFGFLLIRFWVNRPFRPEFTRQERPRRQQQRQDPPRGETDMEYNARKQQRQAEVDRILDKIRKSGYDSLTKAEKQFLFDASRDK